MLPHRVKRQRLEANSQSPLFLPITAQHIASFLPPDDTAHLALASRAA